MLFTELSEVKERHDGANLHVDGYAFPHTCKDCKLLFQTQDKFVAVVAHNVCCDASSSGVICCDDVETVIHNYVPMTHFETAVAKLSAAPNQVCESFPD